LLLLEVEAVVLTGMAITLAEAAEVLEDFALA
jgi:hypothetical protein